MDAIKGGFDPNVVLGPDFQPIRTSPTDAFRRLTTRSVHTVPNADPGYVLDLDGNGQYTPGQDAVVGLDLDGDGILSAAEATRSKAILGNWAASPYDRDRDGKASNEELHDAGARSWVDRDRDGRIGKSESGTIDRFQTVVQEHRLNELDPSRRRATVKTEDMVYRAPAPQRSAASSRKAVK